MQNKSRLELDDYEAVSDVVEIIFFIHITTKKKNLVGNHYKDRRAFLCLGSVGLHFCIELCDMLFCADESLLFPVQENLAKLQRTLSRKWEFIFMQAEAQAK